MSAPQEYLPVITDLSHVGDLFRQLYVAWEQETRQALSVEQLREGVDVNMLVPAYIYVRQMKQNIGSTEFYEFLQNGSGLTPLRININGTSIQTGSFDLHYPYSNQLGLSTVKGESNDKRSRVILLGRQTPTTGIKHVDLELLSHLDSGPVATNLDHRTRQLHDGIGLGDLLSKSFSLAPQRNTDYRLAHHQAGALILPGINNPDGTPQAHLYIDPHTTTGVYLRHPNDTTVYYKGADWPSIIFDSHNNTYQLQKFSDNHHQVPITIGKLKRSGGDIYAPIWEIEKPATILNFGGSQSMGFYTDGRTLQCVLHGFRYPTEELNPEYYSMSSRTV